MLRNKNKNTFNMPQNYISRNEPINIHCFCNKCGERIVLPEKVWIKRGAICNRCYHRIREED